MKKTLIVALILALPVIAVAATDERERSVESFEQLQKVELEKYYYGGATNGEIPKTPMAIEMYNQAVLFFEQGEYSMAKEAALESLQLEARNPMALELLGEIANLKQDFAAAREYYKKSYLLSASPRVREKLEKLSKEELIENKLDTYEDEHFTIKYQRDDPRYEGYEIRNILRDSYRAVSQDLGFYINNKIVVLFYEADEFRYITAQPHYIGGVYDGKIRLPAYRKGFNEQDLKATVTHEMTHAFVSYLSNLRAPAWIQEGLAEYEENKVRPADLSALKAAVKAKTLMPIEQFFLLNINSNLQPKELELFYQRAFSFTSYLVKRFGMYRIKEILRQFGKGDDSFAAIEEVLKISPERLEKTWLATFK